MKTINIGNQFEIYDDSLKVFDQLPTQVYIVRFSKMMGFYLERYPDIKINEDKVYGVHINKVQKVMRSFKMFKRNLGIILSGDKGIGKSLFAKLLCIESVKNNLPVIIVDKFYPGIASYLESIEQEIMVMFNEFDKTFGNIKTGENEADPQAGLLTLFDGISPGKKMFVITCNDLNRLNDYLVNRPGRFHYHFRFEYPSADEIREYLTDKLDERYYSEIEKVISFATKVNINYDCLRSIAFELNNGDTFETAIRDLNIVNTESYEYKITAIFTNGNPIEMYTAYGKYLDMFNSEPNTVWDFNDEIGVIFSPTDAVYVPELVAYCISADKITVTYNDAPEDKQQLILSKIIITRKAKRSLHYTI